MTPPAISRRPIVGVMGSGSEADERAAEVGRLVANKGAHLLTGGGRGAMEAAARAFTEMPDRRGLSIGVIPSGNRSGYPNPWIEIPIQTHLPLSGEQGEEPLSRNHINVLSATAIIALPGGPGTLSEVRLALRYGRPLAAYLRDSAELPGLPDEVEIAADLAAIEQFLERTLG